MTDDLPEGARRDSRDILLAENHTTIPPCPTCGSTVMGMRMDSILRPSEPRYVQVSDGGPPMEWRPEPRRTQVVYRALPCEHQLPPTEVTTYGDIATVAWAER